MASVSTCIFQPPNTMGSTLSNERKRPRTEEEELVGVDRIGGEWSRDEDPDGGQLPQVKLPDHLMPSEWKRLRFVFRNFGRLPSYTGACVESSALECHECKWELEIYPGGESETEDGFLSIYLNCLRMPGATKSVHTNYCIRFGDDRKYVLRNDRTKTYLRVSRGHDKAIRRSDVFNSAKGILSSDGSLRIDVDIQIGLECEYKPSSKFQADMLRVLENADETNSDVLFRVDDRDFYCLSGLLQIRAPELYSLTSDCDVCTPIVIPDVKADTFHHLLRAVYGEDISGKIDSVEGWKDLIRAADRFGSTEVKLRAEHELVTCSFINDDNVADVLLFADGTTCALLKEVASIHFLSNLRAVQKTDGYRKLKKSARLMEELMTEANQLPNNKKKRSAPRDANDRDYKRMCVSALRQKLDEKGLGVDGSRKMLVSRLEKADGLNDVGDNNDDTDDEVVVVDDEDSEESIGEEAVSDIGE